MSYILVIDDERDHTTPLIRYLESEGHTVRYARDGEEGLKVVAERFPDLIFLDIEMPKLTGPEMAYRLLLENNGRERIPIFILSGARNIKKWPKVSAHPTSWKNHFNWANSIKCSRRH
jgi:CheY-like chemotaxis protein